MTPRDTESELRHLSIVVALLWLTVVLGSLSAYTFDFDAANYSLGVQHFDITNHRPHPPGYPLWIASAKMVTLLVRDSRIAQTLLAALFGIGAVIFFFLVAKKLLGPWGALTAASLLAFSSPVLLYSSVQDTYTVDLFASCFIAWLVTSILDGHASRLPLAYASAAVLAGFRQSAVVFLAPILIVATVVAVRRKLWRELGVGVLLAIVAGAAWFVPTAMMTGGVARWRALTGELFLAGAKNTSLFYGAPEAAYWNMVETATVQLVLALFPALVFCVLWRISSFGRRGNSKVLGAPPAWDHWCFYLLWAAPCLLVNFLIHCPKAGYLLLSLPPLLLMIVKTTRLSTPRLPGTEIVYTPRAWFPAILGGVALSLFLAYVRPPSVSISPWVRFISEARMGRPEFSSLVAEGHEELQNVLSLPTDDVLVFIMKPSNEAPNYRTLSVDFPHARLAEVINNQPMLVIGGLLQPLGDLSSRLKTIYWITWPYDIPIEVHQILPQTVRVLRNSLFALWRTDLGPDPLDESLTVVGVPVRLHRAANPALVSPLLLQTMPRISLAHGFGDVESNGSFDWVWAMGPEATVSVKFPDRFTEPLMIAFRVTDAMKSVAGRVLVNGKSDQIFKNFTPRQVIRVAVPRDVNPATVTFEFDRWNGHPTKLVPQDYRPMAVMFESIRAEAGGTTFEILQR